MQFVRVDNKGQREKKTMELTDHKINELNEAITITPDERDAKNGNASHEYKIRFGVNGGRIGEPQDIKFHVQASEGPVIYNAVGAYNIDSITADLSAVSFWKRAWFACVLWAAIVVGVPAGKPRRTALVHW